MEAVEAPENSTQKKIRKTKGKKRSLSNNLMSLFALIISLGTFITFAYQNYLIQKQQYRSVMPYLMVSTYSGSDQDQNEVKSFNIFNNGVGPAFIEDIEINFEGKVYKSIHSFLYEGIFPNSPVKVGTTDIVPGYSIPSNEGLTLIDSKDSTSIRVLDEVFQKMDMKITYSSLYEEKWSVSMSNQRPVQLE